MSRIVQAANFVAPHSGGIRTVLEHLAVGYAAAGHEVVQVVPGRSAATERLAWGTRVTVAGHVVPGTGYRVLGYTSAAAVIDRLAPDRLEVHDRSTLRGLGRWARQHGVPSLVVSHERLDRLATQWLPNTRSVRRAADHSNRSLAAGFDTVVCTTEWACAEFHRVGAPNLRVVPLGVDASRFTPGVDARLRRRFASDDAALLVMTSRMSREKRPDLAIGAVRELVTREVPVALAVAGDGPMRKKLQRLAAGLPVTFTGHLGRGEVAALLATADVAIAPGPVETFGLAALEALASGTPVVCNGRSALPEVLGAAGVVAGRETPEIFADGVEMLLARPVASRRLASVARAHTFDWQHTIRGFLDVHGLVSRVPDVATRHEAQVA